MFDGNSLMFSKLYYMFGHLGFYLSFMFMLSIIIIIIISMIIIIIVVNIVIVIIITIIIIIIQLPSANPPPCPNRWMHGSIDRCFDASMYTGVDGYRINRSIHGSMHRWIQGLTDIGSIERWSDASMDPRIDRYTPSMLSRLKE